MITADLDGAIATGQRALELAVTLGDRTLQGQASCDLGPVYYGASATSAGRPRLPAAERGGRGPGVIGSRPCTGRADPSPRRGWRGP